MRVKRITKEGPGQASDAADLSMLDPLIKKYKGVKGNMIPLLQGAQAIYGYIPKEVFEKLASETGLKLSDMYGVATFYAQFRLNPVGKHIIKVCHGTACHVQDADSISIAIREYLKIKDGETTPDKIFTLESVACLGCCSLAPVMAVGDETFSKLNGKSSVKIIRDIKLSEKN